MRQRSAQLREIGYSGYVWMGRLGDSGPDFCHRRRQSEDVGGEEADGACLRVAEELVPELDELRAEVATEHLRRGVAVVDELPNVRSH